MDHWIGIARKEITEVKVQVNEIVQAFLTENQQLKKEVASKYCIYLLLLLFVVIIIVVLGPY